MRKNLHLKSFLKGIRTCGRIIKPKDFFESLRKGTDKFNKAEYRHIF